MALARKTVVAAPAKGADRRRHQRVKVNLLGRCMLEDGREFTCQVTDMSPGGAALIVPAVGRVGERIVAYIDHIGRMEGRLVRQIEGGFAMTLVMSARKRDRLAAQLTWLANRHILNLPEDRRHDRFVPRNPFAKLILPDGTEMRCRILDVSPSGAAIQVDPKPAVGTPVSLGMMRGRVVRRFEDGVAVEFTIVHSSETLQRYFA